MPYRFDIESGKFIWLDEEVGEDTPLSLEAIDLIRSIVSEEIAKIPAPEKRKTLDKSDIVEIVANEIANLPKPQDGKSVTIEDVYPLVKSTIDSIPIQKGENGVGISQVERVGDKLLVKYSNGNVDKFSLPEPKNIELNSKDNIVYWRIEGGDWKKLFALPKQKTIIGGGGGKTSANIQAMIDAALGNSLNSVVAGTNISVDNTDPVNPIINSLSDRYRTQSSTSNTIVSNGNLTFTVDANLAYISQQEVIIAYDANNHMHGTVVSYSGTTLVVSIKHKTGSGTYSAWTINLDGTPVDSIAGTGNTNEIAFFASAQSIESDPDLIFDKTTNRLGVQKSSPEAAVHVAETTGETIAKSSSGSVSLVAEVACNNPTINTTEIFEPSAPTGSSATFQYVLGALGSSGTASENASGTGFVAENQTITYTIYPYVIISGTKYVHPSTYTQTYTDTSGDSHTFSVYVGDGGTNPWSAVTSADGYILHRSGGGTGTTDGSIDIGGVTSYEDTGFTPTDPATSGGLYLADGKSIDYAVRTWVTFNDNRTGQAETIATITDANDGTAYYVSLSWTPPGVYNGFQIEKNVNSGGVVYTNAGNVTSYNDFSFGDIGAIDAFSGIALPVYPNSMSSVTSVTLTQMTGSGPHFADGSSWDVQIIPYIDIFGVRYFGSPVTTTQTDDNASDVFYWQIDFSSDQLGTYEPDGYLIRYQQNGGGYNNGLDRDYPVTTFPAFQTSDDFTDTDTTITPLLSGYTATTRNYRVYGRRADPVSIDYYSTGYDDYTFTDSNSAPYIIKHTVTLGGNEANYKILGNNALPSGTSYDEGRVEAAATTTVYQTNASFFTVDATVTPKHYGFQAGTSDFPRAYRVYTKKQFGSITIYSSTSNGTISDYLQLSVNDPGGSAYWYVSGSYTDVTGDSGYRILRSVNNGAYSANLDKSTDVVTFVDTSTQSWGGTLTVTPLIYLNQTGIFEKSCSSIDEKPIIALRNTTASSNVNPGLRFEKSDGTSLLKVLTDSNGDLFIEPSESASKAVSFGTQTAPHTVLKTTEYTFNKQLASDATFSVYTASSSPKLQVNGTRNEVYINSGDPGASQGSIMTIWGGSSSQSLLRLNTSGITTNMAVFWLNEGGNTRFQLNEAGHIGLGTGSASNAYAVISPATTSKTQIQLQNTSTGAPSTPVLGGIERVDDKLHFTTSGPTRRTAMLFNDANNPDSKAIPFVKSASPYYETNTEFLFDDTTNQLYVGTTSSFSAKVNIRPGSTSTIGLVVRGLSSQTGNLIETQDVSGGTRFSVDAAGKAVFKGLDASGAAARFLAQTDPSSPSEGDIWNSSTDTQFACYFAGKTAIVQMADFTQVATATVANTVAETALTSTGDGSLTLPANFIKAGRTMRFTIRGYYSSTGSPNITIKLKFGSTVVASTGAVASSNGTNAGWEAIVDVTFYNQGSGATFWAQGRYQELNAGGTMAGMVNTATGTVNGTLSQAISFTAQWGTAAVGNTITATNVYVERIR